jgi:ribosomal protein S24E
VVYGVNLPKADKPYGTVPNPESGLPAKIHNVKDAFAALHELVQDRVSIESNAIHYIGSEKLGDLHIYNDGRTLMRYVPE